MEKYKNRQYNWPDACCIALIEDLSAGTAVRPDYSAVTARSEAWNLAGIRRMGPDPFANYIRKHHECLHPAWQQVDFAEDFKPNDLVFARSASGSYSRRGDFQPVEWQSKPEWPATMFWDGGKMWSFTEDGLKVVHQYREVVRFYRRAA